MFRSTHVSGVALAAVFVARASWPVCALAGGNLGRILPLGDSITSGLNSTGETPGAYRDPLYTELTSNGYTFHFVGSSTSHSTATLTNAGQTAHEGHSGYVITMGGGVSGAQGGISDNIASWMSQANPDVILLMIGTNDINLNYQRVDAPNRLGGLMTQIHGLKPSVRLIVAGITPIGGGDATLDAAAVTYNQGVAQMVANHQSFGENVSFVNMHEALNKNTDLIDSLHPNLAGYQKMADVWYDGIVATVPEPGGLGTLALGVLGLSRRRRRAGGEVGRPQQGEPVKEHNDGEKVDDR